MKIQYEIMVHLANNTGNHPDLPGKVIPFDCVPAVGNRIQLAGFNRTIIADHTARYTDMTIEESCRGIDRRRDQYSTFINKERRIEIAPIVRVDEVLYDEKGKPHLFVYNL